MPGKVLLVEDDDIVRRITLRCLERAGFEVTTATDAPEALRRLQDATEFDLLLTDIGLPVMSGFALASAARQQRPRLPVVYVTGQRTEDVGAQPAGAQGPLVMKPFTVDEILGAVRRSIGEREASGAPPA